MAGAPVLVIHPRARPLVGSVPVPGDRSITRSALLLAGLASGTSRVTGGSGGDDAIATLGALRALGVRTAEEDGAVVVEGNGIDGLRAPSGPIDCGGAAGTMRLLAGVLSAQRFATELVGDASLGRCSMARVAAPLRLRGARIEGTLDPRRPGELTAPLRIGPLPAPHVLSTLEYEVAEASAQVKGAILLSGLWSDGPTYVREPLVSRDHTERLLAALGVPMRSVGAMIALDPASWSGVLPAFTLRVPGDLSAAAYLVVAAQLVPGSRVDVRRAGCNPTRTGLFEILRDMGGALDVEPRGDELGEPVGDLHAAHPGAALRGVRTGGEVVARALDEVPLLCALAARAEGRTEIRDVVDVGGAETAPTAAMARVLGAFGVPVETRPDGLIIVGVPDRPLRAATVASGGDPRVAMTAALLGLVAEGPTRVTGAACIGGSFPRFVGTLRALGADVEVIEA